MNITSVNPVLEPLEPKFGCIAAAMEIMGKKWTALILRDLFSGPKRFCELERSVGKINPRTLSQRLDDLEASDIITKQSFAEVPPRIEYALTQKGNDLVRLIKVVYTPITKNDYEKYSTEIQQLPQ